MDFTVLNALIDAAVGFILASVEKEKSYQQQLADKDKRIADLEAQLTTATSTISVDETELTSLHDKLSQLSGLLNPTTEPVAA